MNAGVLEKNKRKVFDQTILVGKMSWLWKDKKTEQLKNLLHNSFEDDKKSTSKKLSKIKSETQMFKKHVDAAFADARITMSKLNKALIGYSTKDGAASVSLSKLSTFQINIYEVKCS